MAYRRLKSLRDLLVCAKLKPDMSDDEPLGGDTTVRQSKIQILQNDTLPPPPTHTHTHIHRLQSQRLGQQPSLGATLVVRWPMLSTL